jgi:dTDP-4-dehydrorhamnose 3,5-epimerase-like enzyme
MDKLRKIGSHFHRNRGKYLGVLVIAGTVTVVLLYNRKEFWYRNSKGLVASEHELVAFMDSHGIYDDFIDHLRSQGR